MTQHKISLNYGLLLDPYKSNVSFYSGKFIFMLRNRNIHSRFFSTCLSLHGKSPSNFCSRFNFNFLPSVYYTFALTGKEAVNFVTLRDELQWHIGCTPYFFNNNNNKICLVFAVVNLVPSETIYARKNQGKYFGFVERFSLLKSYIKQKFNKTFYHKQGLQCIICSQAAYEFHKMINQVLEYQGKDAEMIHILISF